MALRRSAPWLIVFAFELLICMGPNLPGDPYRTFVWGIPGFEAFNNPFKYFNFFVESADVLPTGQHQVRMEFDYAGGGLGKGGKATLYVDGKKVGEGDIGATLGIVFSADDGCDVGEDSGAPVSPDYGPLGNAFNGEVKGVQLSIADDPDNSDHLVKPEEAIRAALGRQ